VVLGETELVERSNNEESNQANTHHVSPQPMEAIMAGESHRAVPTLTPEQRAPLKEFAASRAAPAREVDRAKVQLD